jgi:hypothetical protein
MQLVFCFICDGCLSTAHLQVELTTLWAHCRWLQQSLNDIMFGPASPVLCGVLLAGVADQLMISEVPYIVEFANSIGRDQQPDDTVVRNCVNLLGDICTVMNQVGHIPSRPCATPSSWLSNIVCACITHIAAGS